MIVIQNMIFKEIVKIESEINILKEDFKPNSENVIDVDGFDAACVFVYKIRKLERLERWKEELIEELELVKSAGEF